MNDFSLWALYYNVTLLFGFVATVILSPRKSMQRRDRIEAAEWHALERRLAVARLKDELAPRVARWRRWRWLRRLLGQ